MDAGRPKTMTQSSGSGCGLPQTPKRTCWYRSEQPADNVPASRNLASIVASSKSLQHEPNWMKGSPFESCAGQKVDVVLSGSGGL